MYRRVIFPMLRRVDPETAHHFTLRMLANAQRVPMLLPVLARLFDYADPRLEVSAFGVSFRNPLGIAAGLDKNGEAVEALLRLGWGHVEVGTITPLPQLGNARPRLWRLPPDRAVINRMGFPGQGADAAYKRLATARRGPGMIGINVGANKGSVEQGTAGSDYERMVERMAAVADYLTINISSPNTARLRDLQGKDALAALIHGVMERREEMAVRKPVLVKIAPDLTPGEIDDVVEVCVAYDVDGLVATNTTLQRPDTLRHQAQRETGGLSGEPLRQRSTEVVRYLRHNTGGKFPVIGVGGVFSGADAFEKLAAGASLVQVYTGFIYEGPGLARRMQRELIILMEQAGFRSIAELIGSATY